MPKPETNLWNLLRQRLKDKGYFFTRIENRSGGGIPDTYIVGDQGCFWVELKVTNGNKINVSPHQIAWHTSHSFSNGVSFFLVKDPRTSNLFLFEGVLALNLRACAFDNIKDRSLICACASEDFWVRVSDISRKLWNKKRSSN